MATYTLTANSNYSAIKGSLANNDTIDCAGFQLTIDEQPLLTGIAVTTPGTAGTMVVSGAYDLSTWSATAGTVPLIATFPAGASLGTATGGSAVSARCITTNSGTVTTANGGSANGAVGVSTNNGTITTANGGSTFGAHGVNINNGTVTTANGGIAGSANGVSTNNSTVTTANGGSATNAHGVASNFSTVTTANGGSVGNAHGVNANSSTVTTANGGTNATAYGVNSNSGFALRGFDSTGLAVNVMRGGPKLIIGPDWQCNTTNYTSVDLIYSIGEVSGSGSIPVGTTVTILSEGTGGGVRIPNIRGGADQ